MEHVAEYRGWVCVYGGISVLVLVIPHCGSPLCVEAGDEVSARANANRRVHLPSARCR